MGASRIRLVIGGLVCAGLAAVHAENEYDKRINFQPIDARVSVVRDRCYMEKPEGRKNTWTSDLLSCEEAVVLTRTHPKWQDYEIKHKIEVRFAYVSPVDGTSHESSLELADYPGGRPLQAGDIIPVQASRTVASKTRANDWLDIQLGRHAPGRGSI